jgi:PAS domain S-box-containing protein
VKRRISLKRALTLNFLLVGIVPILVFGFVAVTLLENRLLEGLEERNQLLARDIGEETKQFLSEIRLDDRYLEQTVQNSQFFESIYILDRNYRIVNLGLDLQAASRREDYKQIDFSSHALFRKVREMKRPSWSDTFVSPVTGEPAVTLGLPLADGFLLGDISLGRLSQFLLLYSQGAKAEFAIVDRNGMLIAHSNAELAIQRINFSFHPEVESALAGKDITVKGQHHGLTYIESAVRLPVTGWAVWVGVDMETVTAPLRNLRNLLVAFMALGVALAGTVALRSARRLLSPLAILGEGVEQIGKGNYDFRHQSSGYKEIDRLAEKITDMTQDIEDRETSILASESRFRDLVNSIDGIVWERNYATRKFSFVSRKTEDFLGFPVESWLNDPEFWANQLHPEDRETTISYCRLMVEQGRDHGCEYRMVAADGRTVWMKDLVRVVYENDNPVSILGVMINITRQKELDEELLRSEQNYREIFNATGDAIFIHDIHTGQIKDVNRAMLEMYGYTFDEALQQQINDLSLGSSPYSAKEARARIRQAYEQGEAVFEWYARKKSGELFWTEVSLRRAMIGDEERILAVVRDITDRKLAEEQLKEVNERLQLLIDYMPMGCMVLSSRFTVDLWNPAAEKMFGFTQEEMLGQSMRGRILDDEVWPMVEGLLQQNMAGDMLVRSENANLTKDGRKIICDWVNTPLKDSRGKVVGVISMAQDVTERKASEEELHRYRQHLEELVAQRTIELEKAQDELVQSERLAVLGQLTATVSHEIRNPLGTVSNALYLLRETMGHDQLQRLQRPLELAERNVQRCDGIISELLDFSKRRELQTVSLDINAWLTSVLDEMPRCMLSKKKMMGGSLTWKLSLVKPTIVARY